MYNMDKKICKDTVSLVYDMIDLVEQLNKLEWTTILRETAQARGRDCGFAQKACVLVAVDEADKYRDIVEKLTLILGKLPTKEELYDNGK